MRFDDGIFGLYSRLYENRREVEFSLEDYLGKCSDNPSYYAGAAERMLKAIGEPVTLDLGKNPRLGRRFGNRIVKVYREFTEFFGMEETIRQIIERFQDAARTGDEVKLLLVGSGCDQCAAKLAERLQQAFARQPVWILKADEEISPSLESPFGVLRQYSWCTRGYEIPSRLLKQRPSRWATEKLRSFSGDPRRFTVVRLRGSRRRNVCIAETGLPDSSFQDANVLIRLGDLTVAYTNAGDYHIARASNRILVIRVPDSIFLSSAERKALEGLMRAAGFRRRAQLGDARRSLATGLATPSKRRADELLLRWAKIGAIATLASLIPASTGPFLSLFARSNDPPITAPPGFVAEPSPGLGVRNR